MSSVFDSLPPWPEEDFTAFGPTETIKRGRIQKIVGKFLGRNWVTIPHVTHHDDIDITELEERRAAWNRDNPNAKVTPVVPLIKAVALTLPEFPDFASSLDATGETLTRKRYAHIGVAVEVPGGLLVPVLRDCDSKPLSVIAAELSAIAAKARTKGLSIQEMTGGCMSISSLGNIGGTGFTPIVNAPETAILGLTKVQLRPRPDASGSGIEWRKALPASLSYDHRVINGADAARFVVAVAGKLETIAFS